MRTRVLLALSLGLVSPAAARAGSPDCPNLASPASDGFPAGLNGAATMGPSTQVEQPARHVAVPSGALDTVSIALERNQCYGTCPAYSVVIHGDGSASYDGRDYVMVGGHHDFTVPPAAVRCLLDQFRNADFWSLADTYEADISDGARYRVTLTIGGMSKSLTDYFGSVVGMPKIVTALEDEIDRIAADRWVKGTDDTLPSLREENFDFHSPTAATMLANGAASAPAEVIAGLLEAGTPLTGTLTGYMWRPGTTAVESATRAGRTTVVESMIARGAFAAGPPGVKERALRAAASSGDPTLVADVLRAKPDVDARGPEGETALIDMWRARLYAKDKAKVDIPRVARLLLAAGANPNLADLIGETALFGASDARVVGMLIAAGATIDARNRYGGTPLLDAATDEAAVALIEAGADSTAKDKAGRTVESTAEDRKFEKTLRVLHGRAPKR